MVCGLQARSPCTWHTVQSMLLCILHGPWTMFHMDQAITMAFHVVHMCRCKRVHMRHSGTGTVHALAHVVQPMANRTWSMHGLQADLGIFGLARD